MPFVRRSQRHAACSTAGRRAVNEDRAATLAAGSGRLIAVVADGMGGARAGDVASDAAMRAFLLSVRGANGDNEPEMLHAAFAAADRAIRDAATPERRGMGSTLVAAITRGTDVWIGNIGDSRAVLVTEDDVTPLSSDHSVVGEALRKGQISEVEALRHPDRHVISRAIGEGDARPDMQFHSMEGVDDGNRTFVLLGSDGLFNFIGDSEILELAHEARTAAEVVERVVRRAVENGSDDNVSAAALSIGARRKRLLPVIAIVAVVMAILGGAWRMYGTDLRRGWTVLTAQGATLWHSHSRSDPRLMRVTLPVGAGRHLAAGMTGSICSAPNDCFASWRVIATNGRSVTLEIRAADGLKRRGKS